METKTKMENEKIKINKEGLYLYFLHKENSLFVKIQKQEKNYLLIIVDMKEKTILDLTNMFLFPNFYDFKDLEINKENIEKRITNIVRFLYIRNDYKLERKDIREVEKELRNYLFTLLN